MGLNSKTPAFEIHIMFPQEKLRRCSTSVKKFSKIQEPWNVAYSFFFNQISCKNTRIKERGMLIQG